MKAIKYTFLSLAIATTLITTSCANSDDVSVPTIEYHQATPTITLDQLYAKANTTLQQYTENDIIEAYVSSSDEGGTFYKSVSFQNLEGTLGFSVPVDMYNIVNDMAPGRKVYIYLKDMHFMIANGSLVVGDIFEETSVGRMSKSDFYKKVLPSNVKVAEKDLVHTRTLAELKSDKYINTLVEIEKVQFADKAVGKTYYDAANVLGGATNHNIEDATGTMIFRTSEFAKFASQVVVKNSGKIRGVLTKFNSDYQFMARTFNDIQLTEDRIGEDPGNGEEPTAPTNLFFTGSDFENWASFTGGVNNFGLKSYAVQGMGTGALGTNSLHINGTPTANDYVFTIMASAKGTIPATPTKITFWVKGTSTKSLSLNIYRAGSGYDVFNVSNLNSMAVTLNKADLNDAGNGTNAYAGTIDTNGKWVKVTLNISNVAINTAATGDIFALKVGSNAAYDLHIDNFEIH
ncbi:hypothetical protein H1R17_03755 [Flavobacterium sp. xlx-214]|uniref:DUF5689 domain-containing protein n=1 Tax=unclassified Flavobacterium TaxID=196869 RepID=UPI0013D6FBA9|nr:MULTISPECIES: DUF5689 domain-containing protein [unclassified Flavobacterium]MBA5792006.1 hypothetical protein [Flavobacterium sp. xlx-221]QMI84260.1 hypothetical protein H1R17_03755 [Flavobacterium sp. xlx-214]